MKNLNQNLTNYANLSLLVFLSSRRWVFNFFSRNNTGLNGFFLVRMSQKISKSFNALNFSMISLFCLEKMRLLVICLKSGEALSLNLTQFSLFLLCV